MKEGIVRQKGFKNKVLEAESVAEFDYRPKKCKKTYRMVVVRKNISVQKGEAVLFDEIRYFFYITNRRELTQEEVVGYTAQSKPRNMGYNSAGLETLGKDEAIQFLSKLRRERPTYEERFSKSIAQIENHKISEKM